MNKDIKPAEEHGISSCGEGKSPGCAGISAGIRGCAGPGVESVFPGVIRAIRCSFNLFHQLFLTGQRKGTKVYG